MKVDTQWVCEDLWGLEIKVDKKLKAGSIVCVMENETHRVVIKGDKYLSQAVITEK